MGSNPVPGLRVQPPPPPLSARGALAASGAAAAGGALAGGVDPVVFDLHAIAIGPVSTGESASHSSCPVDS